MMQSFLNRIFTHRLNVLTFILMSLLTMISCIKLYEPEIQASDEKKYVVTGQVAAGDSIQTVNVSITSPIGSSQFLPVEGCQVTIFDDKGNIFPLSYANKGNYVTTVDQQFLQAGISFKVEVMTPEGEIISSDYDEMSSSPQMDSVYYERKDIEGNTPAQFTKGIQFYVDLKGSDSESRYYRWEVIDTWEYHTLYPLEWYYDGTVHHVVPPDYSKMICWTTHRVPNIFTLTTDNLQENKYVKYPLHYVDNRTTKLAYGYSVLVRQYALSRPAFIYFEQLKINSDPQGGLYEKQPLAIRGNMHNMTHPESIVLGFFSGTTVKSKRIFVRPIPDLPLDYNLFCDPIQIRGGLAKIKHSDYPVYLLGNSQGYTMYWLDRECVDCESLGGTIIKPSFWPQ